MKYKINGGIVLELICSGCGKQLSSGCNFCPECGKKLDKKPTYLSADVLLEILNDPTHAALLRKVCETLAKFKDLLIAGNADSATVPTDPGNRADPDVSKTAPIVANVTSEPRCPYGHSDHHSCGHCTLKGACDVTVLTSMPPQYNICPFRGSGYIYCKDA